MNNLKKYLVFGKSPEGDWKTIFITTATFIVLMSLLNIYMFIQVNNGGFMSTEEEGEQTKNIDISVLRETLSYYQLKTSAFEDIFSGTTTPIVDPSI